MNAQQHINQLAIAIAVEAPAAPAHSHTTSARIDYRLIGELRDALAQAGFDLSHYPTTYPERSQAAFRLAGLNR